MWHFFQKFHYIYCAVNWVIFSSKQGKSNVHNNFPFRLTKKKLFSKRNDNIIAYLMTIFCRLEDRENNILLEKFEWQMSDRFNCCVQITDFFASFWQEMRKKPKKKNWFSQVCILFWLQSQLAFFSLIYLILVL